MAFQLHGELQRKLRLSENSIVKKFLYVNKIFLNVNIKNRKFAM